MGSFAGRTLPLLACSSMEKKPRRITLAVLLSQMQGMKYELVQRIDGVKHDLSQRMDGMEKRLGSRIDRLERKTDLISVQIENMDARLDDIEVFEIPKFKKAVGIRQ